MKIVSCSFIVNVAGGFIGWHFRWTVKGCQIRWTTSKWSDD